MCVDITLGHGARPDPVFLLGGRGLADDVAERFAYASLAVFIVPLIPHCMLTVGGYFLLRWLVS